MSLNLLIIDDEEVNRRSCRKAVDIWNENGQQVRIILEECEELKDAKDLLAKQNFDAVIIDLKFPEDSGNAASGNTLIGEIKESLCCPVYVLSGNLAELEEALTGNELIEAFTRGTNILEEILPKISRRYSTGITKIMGRQGKLEEALRKVFWEYLPKAIVHWEEETLENHVKEKQMLRYALAHIQEILDIDETGKDEYRNRAETYITPPVRETIFSGAVLRLKEEKRVSQVLITPACTLSNDEPDFIQLAALIDLKNHPKLTNKQKGDTRKQAAKGVIENKNQRYHFLPHFNNIKASFVDFKQIKSIAVQEYSDSYEVVCGIAPAFLKDLINRFSAYYARQGSPDFNSSLLSVEINNLLGSNAPSASS